MDVKLTLPDEVLEALGPDRDRLDAGKAPAVWQSQPGSELR